MSSGLHARWKGDWDSNGSDIVVRSIAGNGDPKSTLVKDVMTKNVITAEPEMDAYTAAEILRKQNQKAACGSKGKSGRTISIGDLATRHIFHNEAGHALSEISQPSRPMNMTQ